MSYSLVKPCRCSLVLKTIEMEGEMPKKFSSLNPREYQQLKGCNSKELTSGAVIERMTMLLESDEFFPPLSTD